MGKDVISFSVYKSRRILVYAKSRNAFFNKFRKCESCIVRPMCLKLGYIRRSTHPWCINIFNPCKPIRMKVNVKVKG